MHKPIFDDRITLDKNTFHVDEEKREIPSSLAPQTSWGVLTFNSKLLLLLTYRRKRR